MDHFLPGGPVSPTFCLSVTRQSELPLFRFFPESQVAYHKPEKFTRLHYRDFFTPAGIVAACRRTLFCGFFLFFCPACINGFFVSCNHFYPLIILTHSAKRGNH